MRIVNFSFLAIALILFCAIMPVAFATASSSPILSIVFDDGRISQFQYAYPLMEARGLHGTYYVITDNIRDVSNNSQYMSYDELLTLQNAGNEIGSHGKSHAWMPGRSESYLRYEYSTSEEALINHGLMVNNFAYPCGGSDAFANSIGLQYYNSLRTGYDYPCGMSTPYPSILKASAGESDGDALNRLKIMVDSVANSNQWSIFFFHNVGTTSQSCNISIEDFTAFLDYVVAKGLQVCTINEVLSGSLSVPISAPIATPSPTLSPPIFPASLSSTPLGPTSFGSTPTAIKTTPTPSKINLIINPSPETVVNDSPEEDQNYQTPQMNSISKSLQIGLLDRMYYPNSGFIQDFLLVGLLVGVTLLFVLPSITNKRL